MPNSAKSDSTEDQRWTKLLRSKRVAINGKGESFELTIGLRTANLHVKFRRHGSVRELLEHDVLEVLNPLDGIEVDVSVRNSVEASGKTKFS